ENGGRQPGCPASLPVAGPVSAPVPPHHHPDRRAHPDPCRAGGKTARSAGIRPWGYPLSRCGDPPRVNQRGACSSLRNLRASLSSTPLTYLKESSAPNNLASSIPSLSTTRYGTSIRWISSK